MTASAVLGTRTDVKVCRVFASTIAEAGGCNGVSVGG